MLRECVFPPPFGCSRAVLPRYEAVQETSHLECDTAVFCGYRRDSVASGGLPGTTRSSILTIPPANASVPPSIPRSRM